MSPTLVRLTFEHLPPPAPLPPTETAAADHRPSDPEPAKPPLPPPPPTDCANRPFDWSPVGDDRAVLDKVAAPGVVAAAAGAADRDRAARRRRPSAERHAHAAVAAAAADRLDQARRPTTLPAVVICRRCRPRRRRRPAVAAGAAQRDRDRAASAPIAPLSDPAQPPSPPPPPIDCETMPEEKSPRVRILLANGRPKPLWTSAAAGVAAAAAGAAERHADAQAAAKAPRFRRSRRRRRRRRSTGRRRRRNWRPRSPASSRIQNRDLRFCPPPSAKTLAFAAFCPPPPEPPTPTDTAPGYADRSSGRKAAVAAAAADRLREDADRNWRRW